jgi:translation initiation factor 3 subunit A
MLSTMTVGGLKDRTDRDLVLPWLKFLWETYRSILELLHKNVKLERVYSKTCERAFAFCLDYQRTLEFRRLCEMLRQQLSNIQKQIASLPTTKLSKLGLGSAVDWTPESIEIQLQIRFNQLEVATTMEQWNEGFRTVEDIYSIMQLFKKVPKPKLMSVYYEKLTRIFWSSENYLFHAYAWSKYYQLYQEYKKETMKSEEKNLLASSVLLSAICIPSLKNPSVASASNEVSSSGNGNMSWLYDDEDILFEKNQQMALLLDFQSNPTRDALLGGIVSKGVLEDAYPEMKQLYAILETRFCPLTMISEVAPILTFVKNHSILSQYAPLLQKVLILKCVSQLSTVFSTYKISSLQNLMRSLGMSSVEIEKILVDSSGKGKIFQLSIDHSTDCYHFGSQVDQSTIIENQVVKFGYQFQKIVERIEPQSVATSAASYNEYFNLIKKSYQEEAQQSLTWIVERKMIIERRKEGLERLQKDKVEKEERRKLEEEGLRKLEEVRRLKLEEDERNREKIRKLQELKTIQRMVKTFESYGKIVDENQLKELTEKERRELLQKTQEEAKKGKDDEVKRLAEQWKALDYKTRVIRIESRERHSEQYNQQLEADQEVYKQKVLTFLKDQEEKHAIALETRNRLSRTRVYRQAFEQQMIDQQQQIYDDKLTALKAKALNDHRKRKIARARQLKSQEDERIEMELTVAQDKALEAERLAAQVEELRKKREQEILAREQEELLREKSAPAPVPAPAPAPARVNAGPPIRGPDRVEEREVERDEPGPWKRSGPPASAPRQEEPRRAEPPAREPWRPSRDTGRDPRDEPGDRAGGRWNRDGPTGGAREEQGDRPGGRWNRDGPSREEQGDRPGGRWNRDGPTGGAREEQGDRPGGRWNRDGPSGGEPSRGPPPSSFSNRGDRSAAPPPPDAAPAEEAGWR